MAKAAALLLCLKSAIDKRSCTSLACIALINVGAE